MINDKTAQHKVCIDCATAFEFSPAEQIFYRKMEYADPKRCSDCRRVVREHWSVQRHVKGSECFECNTNLIRGVRTTPEHNCIACGRHIDKDADGGRQYPVVKKEE